MKNVLKILTLMCALAWADLSFADIVMMSFAPADKGTFMLTGENIAGVQAFDIEIDYDASLLSNPFVQVRGGNLASVNSGSPGKLLLNINRPNAGPIIQISLRFKRSRDAEGGIYHISASGSSVAGSASPVADDATASSIPSSSASDGMAGGPVKAVGSPAGAAKGTHVPGILQERSDTVPGKSVESEAAAAAAARTGPQATVIDTVFYTDDRTAALLKDENSVLRRFKKYKGETGLKAFAALFEQGAGGRMAQEPAIALSDGKTPVTLTLHLQQNVANSPNISLFNAKIVSVQKKDETTMSIVVMPAKGAWDARLAIATGMEMTEFPLVVAPVIKLEGNINEDNFLAALHAYVADQAMIRQGEYRSYLFWYIFTANYLAAEPHGPQKTTSRSAEAMSYQSPESGK